MVKIHYQIASVAALIIVGSLIAFALSNRDTAVSQMTHESHEMNQRNSSTTPTMTGQDTFAAIQEIVTILEADPTTDWNQVNLAALREHLVDMNEVMLDATIAERDIEGGLETTITGTGRTAEAISRLVPAQAQELNQMDGMQATVTSISNGVRLTMISISGEQAEKIRNLGFIGLLVKGTHHQEHHLALAKGVEVH
uniref:Uncharacterized protein n=1 Tax=Oscillatoriales cyanobacterium SpSt-402 TaxID=2282168 RepID=A0A832GY97_9CYAN